MAHPRIVIEARAQSHATIVRLVRRRGAAALPRQRRHAGARRRRGGARTHHRPARVVGGLPRASSARVVRHRRHPALARRLARRPDRPQRPRGGARRRRRARHARRRLPGRRRAARRQPHLDRSRRGRTARATSSTRASSAARRKAVFNGRILVRPDAQKTDAKQTNRALLLSDEAQINTKPQLEIFADDVKCTHGATVGQLDEDALFYLQARGLDAGRRPATCCCTPSPARCSARSRCPNCAWRSKQRLFDPALVVTWPREADVTADTGDRRRDRRQRLDVDACARSSRSSRRKRTGSRLVYLDNAATTQKPRAVLDAIARYYADEQCQRPPRRARAVASGRRRPSRAPGTTWRRSSTPPAVSEIVFTRNATEGINLVAQSWGGANLGAGDEVLISAMEHHSNIVPWQLALRAHRGARCRSCRSTIAAPSTWRRSTGCSANGPGWWP